ncbi:MAG: restriction endonuclease subunit S [Bacteroidales bacterium]|nr:restriction endonuclease subunit S [Bacteroidales bacterium]
MKEGWTYKSFSECINKIPKQKQVKSKDYKLEGRFPIVSQEKDLISGYWDDESYVYRHAKPIIIFGDHTKEIKYIDFDFVVGADGTQILYPKENINTKFFYYALLSTPIRTLGYARHFKLLKERTFLIPSISEQRSIVARLDVAFANIDSLKTNAEKQLTEARQLFQSELTECMKPKPGWKEKKIKEVGEVIGGTTPSTTNPEYWGGDICWISPAELNGEHYLYDSVKKITKKAVEEKSLKQLSEGTVILSSRAPIGKLAINKVPMYCNQGFKCITCGDNLYNEFLYWWLYGKTEYLNSIGTGATFPEISKTVVENIVIPLPPQNTQHQIVSHLDALSSQIKQLEEKQRKIIAECDALKQAMLREVFE